MEWLAMNFHGAVLLYNICTLPSFTFGEQHQQHMECQASRQLVQLAFVGDHDDEVVIDYIIYLLSPSTHSM